MPKNDGTRELREALSDETTIKSDQLDELMEAIELEREHGYVLDKAGNPIEPDHPESPLVKAGLMSNTQGTRP